MTLKAPPLTFNELLARSGVDPAEVIVFRHRPWESALNRTFEWIVAERPDLFDCYQDSHAVRTEAALCKARYVASFIRKGPGAALFVGLYERMGQTLMSCADSYARPSHQELIGLGMSGDFATAGRDSLLIFDLRRTDWHSEWSARLLIKWPGLERSWYRWADRNIFEIEAIATQSLLLPPPPQWDEITLNRAELLVMPSNWRTAVAQWRGIYLITDTSDHRHYVGSACGDENILQRWAEYAATGHGGNKHLRTRDPANFRFSILQLMAPDSRRDDVIALEQKWKARLGTAFPTGLNDN